MAHIIPDSSVPSGWQCPACRHVYGPQATECTRCPETPPAPLFPFPGTVRLPSEYGAIPDLPPRAPMCRCSLVPCPPSREGGMCGCGEPDDSPFLRLPGYMAGLGAVQVAGVTGTWSEVFPGLEATLRSVRTGHAEVEFRLTPPDGQQHD